MWYGVVWCGVVCVVWCGVPKALLPKGKRPGCLPTGTGKRAGLCVLCACAQFVVLPHQAVHPALGRASCTRQVLPHQAGPPSPGRASCSKQGIPHQAGHPAPGRASCTRQGILHQAGHPPWAGPLLGLSSAAAAVVPCCAVLCCAVLCCVLCCVLCRAVSCCAVLRCDVLCCVVLCRVLCYAGAESAGSGCGLDLGQERRGEGEPGRVAGWCQGRRGGGREGGHPAP